MSKKTTTMMVPPTPSKFTITYLPNGGSGSEIPMEYDPDEVVQVQLCNFDAPTGKYFTAWVDENGSIYQPNDLFHITSDMRLSAQWTDIPAEYHGRVVYKAGIEGIKDVIEYALAGDELKHIRWNMFPVPEGKVFKCWSVDIPEMGVEGMLANPGNTFGTQDLEWILTAVFETPTESSVIIEFKKGIGEGTEQTIIYDDDAERMYLPDNIFLAPDGMLFAGWLNENTGEIMTQGDRIAVVSTVFTAQFLSISEMYSITYMPGYTDPSVQPIVKYYKPGTMAPLESNDKIFPVPEGYECIYKWVDQDGRMHKTRFGDKILMDKDYIQTAIWQLVAVEHPVIKFMAGEHTSGEGKTFTCNRNDLVDVISYAEAGIIADSDYIFDNNTWIDQYGEEQAVGRGFYASSDYTLTPKVMLFRPSHPKITYVNGFDGWDDGERVVDEFNLGDKVTIRPFMFPLPEGYPNYRLKYWHTQSYDGNEIKYTEGQEFIILQDITIMSHCDDVCIVTFKAGEGTGADEVCEFDKYYGHVLNRQYLFTPPAGKMFMGWWSDEEGRIIGPRESIEFYSNEITLTAYYEDMPEDAITIRFLPGDGSGEIQSFVMRPYSNFIIPECKFTPPAGKMFIEWNREPDTGYIPIHPGDEMYFNENTDLTPVWEDKVTITYNPGTGIGEIITEDAWLNHNYWTKKLTDIKYLKPTFTDPTNEQFFMGWFSEQTGLVQEIERVVPEGDIEFTAWWGNPTYSVQFLPNGGTGIIVPKIAKLGHVIYLPKCTFTPPSGQVFKKWQDKDNPSKTYKEFEGVYITKATELMAVWGLPPLTIILDPNNGTEGDIKTIVIEVGESIRLDYDDFIPPARKKLDCWVGEDGTRFELDSEITPTQSMRITASYVDYKPVLRYQRNEWDSPMVVEEHEWDEEVTVKDLMVPVDSWGQFSNWRDQYWNYYNPGDTIIMDSDYSLSIEQIDREDSMLHIVTLNYMDGDHEHDRIARRNDGVYLFAEGTDIISDELDLSTIADWKIPEGKELGGWMLDGAFFALDQRIPIPDYDITITAVWSRIGGDTIISLNAPNDIAETLEPIVLRNPTKMVLSCSYNQAPWFGLILFDDNTGMILKEWFMTFNNPPEGANWITALKFISPGRAPIVINELTPGGVEVELSYITEPGTFDYTLKPVWDVSENITVTIKPPENLVTPYNDLVLTNPDALIVRASYPERLDDVLVEFYNQIGTQTIETWRLVFNSRPPGGTMIKQLVFETRAHTILVLDFPTMFDKKICISDLSNLTEDTILNLRQSWDVG